MSSTQIHDPLLQWRDKFPILQECNYLVSHSLGAMPRRVNEYLQEYADTWATRGVRAWNDRWFELNGEVGDKIGRIMNAPDGTVSVHQNASLTIAILLSAIQWGSKRRKVVVTDMIFPTDYYSMREILPDDVQVEMVKGHDGISIDTDALLDAIDESTRLVLIGHVLFRSGAIMPAKAIVEKAHQVGAEVVLDGYHSVGVIPVDVQDLNVDYYIGGVLKWMCGGPGGVFLYVRPDLLTALQPKITGWFAHKRPFAFEIDRIDLREDSYRLLNGTFGVASLYSIQAGVDIITEVGVDAIRAKSKKMTSLLLSLAEEAGFTMKSPMNSEERGGMVVVEPPHSYEVSRAMLAQNIVIDYRANAGIRIAPHFYNTIEEVQTAITAMREIVDTGRWRDFVDQQDFVT